MKPKKILILALVSGLITTAVFYLFISRLQPSAAEQPSVVSVVTVNQDIGENQQITEENIALVEMPESQVHAQAVKDKTAVIGKFTAAPIKAGEVVMLHRIQQAKEETTIISKKIKEGYRAVSVSVDSLKSVSNLTEPGDYVDVVLTKLAGDGENAGADTEIILEKVKVLAVGQRMVEKKEGEAPVEYTAVTLELNQQDTVKVINASQIGTLHLTLHSRILPATEAEQSEEEAAGQKEEKAADTSASHVVVIPPHALIRSQPELSAPVTTVVEAGTSLRYLDKKKTDQADRIWLQIETPEQKKGWISSRIVKYENE